MQHVKMELSEYMKLQREQKKRVKELAALRKENEQLRARIAELEADALPFTSPDLRPVTKDEIMAGG